MLSELFLFDDSGNHSFYLKDRIEEKSKPQCIKIISHMTVPCKTAKGSCNSNFSEILVPHWGYKWINQALSPTGTFSQYWYQNSSVTVGKLEANKSHAHLSLLGFSTKFTIQVALTSAYSHLFMDLSSSPQATLPPRLFPLVNLPVISILLYMKSFILNFLKEHTFYLWSLPLPTPSSKWRLYISLQPSQPNTPHTRILTA